MIAQRLAEFITSTNVKEFPNEVVHYAKMLTLSFLGSTIAGSVEPASNILTQYIKGEGGAPEAGVIGKGMMTSATQAALASGTFSHAHIDFEPL